MELINAVADGFMFVKAEYCKQDNTQLTRIEDFYNSAL